MQACLEGQSWRVSTQTSKTNVTNVEYHQCITLVPSMSICAEEAGKDACQGDSGGPLVIPEPGNGRYALVGVVRLVAQDFL